MPTYPQHGETADERDVRLRSYRYPGGPSMYARPQVEPLASRLERAQRVEACRARTEAMLDDLQRADVRWQVLENVWAKGVCVPFFVFGTEWGFFLIWTMDGRWDARQAALVAGAREQTQRDLGDGFSGQVEAVFHLPLAETGWHRHVLIDDATHQPIDVVAIGGRIDEVLSSWQPAGGVGLDPVWAEWLCEASQPRWWLSRKGRLAQGTDPAERA